MKLIILLLTLTVSLSTRAQNVAINNDASLPDNSALLDIKSNSKGVLIPRMNTAGVLAISNPAKGLLVLDTAKNQLMVNMGSAAAPNWQTILATSGWSLTGNSGTDSATNFIGTTDNKPFTIKVNNKRSAFINTFSLNTSFGYQALDSFTSGSSNTAAGYRAMFKTKTGINNTGVGTESLYENTIGSFNAAIGFGALYKNTSGSQNTALGQLAMYNNTTGNRNTSTGSDALRYNDSGSDNIALGYTALYFNTTGNANVAIGTGALFNTGNRSYLVAVGDSALFNNGTGTTQTYHGIANMAIGSKALFNNTTGYYNSAAGTDALTSNTSGFQNSAFGTGSLRTNSNGFANTSIGFNSMFFNTSGNTNSAFGNAALSSNVSGNSNSAFGTSALSNNQSGSNNTAIGYSANVGTANSINATAIGSNAQADCNNCLVLGSVNGINGATAAVRVGIGVTNPLARLHVADSSALFSANGQASETPGVTPISGEGRRMMWYIDKAAFRTGYTSGSEWDKDNVGYFSFATGISSKANGNLASFAAGYNTVASGETSTAMGLNTIAKSHNSFVAGKFNDTSNTNRLFEIGNGTADNARTNAMTILTNGNTGIGTAAPIARLHVADSNVVFTGSSFYVFQSTAYAPPVQGPGARMMWYPQKAAFRSGSVDGDKWDKDNIGVYSFATGFNSKAGAFSSAFGSGTTASGEYSTAMGAGTTASGTYSTAMGTGAIASGFSSTAMGYGTIAKSGYALATGTYNDTTNTSPLFVIGNGSAEFARSNAFSVSANGNTGIGISSPNAPLQFANSLVNRKLVLYDGNNNDNQYYGFGINSSVLRYQVDATTASHVFYAGTGAGSSAELIRIKGNGNVGIGNTNPTRPLSFPATLGEKILFYPGPNGETGIGVYGNELRLHADNPGAKVSFGTQDNAGNFSENALAQRNGVYAFSVLGSLWVNGTTYASDERFKQNISSIQSPLQKLMQLNGVEYEMKTDAFPKNYFQSGRQIGLLAQNVEKIIPEAVNEKDGYKGVDYARLVPLLIESIKALNEKIELQNKQIEELKNKK